MQNLRRTAALLAIVACTEPQTPAIVLDATRPFEGRLEGALAFSVPGSGHLRVEQQGTDVAVRVLDERGTELLRADRRRTSGGTEHVELPPEARTLELVLARPGAPAGAVKVTFQDVVPAAIEAGRRLAAGDRALVESTKASLARAVPLHDAALATFRALGDRTRIGDAALARAETAMATGDQIGARALVLEARDAYRAAEDPQGWAAATVVLARIEKETGEAERARAYAEEAEKEARAAGDELLAAAAELQIGHAQLDLDRPAEAMSLFQRALKTAERHADRRLAAAAHGQIGWTHVRRGERDETLRAFERMNAIAEELGHLELRGLAQHNLGTVRSDFDRDWAAALPFFRRACELLGESGNRAAEAYSLDATGEMESTLGDERAIPRHERALVLRREVGALRGEAQTLTSLGSAHTRLGRPELSVEPLQRAAEVFARIGDRTWEAYAFFRVARAEYARARYREAMDWAQRALDITESLRGRIASDDGRAYYSASVRWYFDVYVAAAAREHIATGDRGALDRALYISEQARARSLVDMMSLVEADLPSAPPELLERIRALRREVRDLDREESKLLASGSTDAERAKALAAKLAAALAEHEQLSARAAKLDPAGAALVSAPIPSLEDVQRRLIDDRTVVLEYHLGAATGSWVLAISTSSAAAYALEKDAVIDAAARKLHGALAARNTGPADESAAARKLRVEAADREAELAAAEVSRLVLAPVARALAGKERLLVIADGALHYVPFASLPWPGATPARRVPAEPAAEAASGTRAAAVLGGERAIEGDPAAGLAADAELAARSAELVVGRLAVSTAPSLTVLSVVRNARRRRPSSALAVFGDPIFERDDPRLGGKAGAALANVRTGTSTLARLRFTRAECEAIASLAPGATLALDAAATRERALSAAARGARLLHFATHGILDSAHPERSGLVLSTYDARGAPTDGFLRLADVYDLDLAAEVVTLSACETALGREVRSEGLIGLSRGFLHAGARSVVASLWKVHDRATGELMKRFYTGLLAAKLPPDRALREAQLELARDPRFAAPYYWSPFVLSGDPGR